MAYSEQEIRAFAEKDRRIVRQSSLKVAADLVIAADKEKNDIATLSSATMDIAQALTDWVYEKSVNSCAEKHKEPGNTQQLPTPTLAQKKVLDAIQDKLVQFGTPTKGLIVDELYSSVLKWAEAIYGSRSYPTKLDSVQKFIEWNNTLSEQSKDNKQ